MGDRKRIEVTFDTEKHADILAEMEKFGNSAGFLKFAAAHYINMIRSNKSSGISNVRDLYKNKTMKNQNPRDAEGSLRVLEDKVNLADYLKIKSN